MKAEKPGNEWSEISATGGCGFCFRRGDGRCPGSQEKVKIADAGGGRWILTGCNRWTAIRIAPDRGGRRGPTTITAGRLSWNHAEGLTGGLRLLRTSPAGMGP